MCGIGGIMAHGANAPRPCERELLAIRDHMRARGPDGAGLWRAPHGETLLAHRRLSILDLSNRAAQPMASATGRHVVVFNGEIYNYRELRRELEATGSRFVTDCDTEILLHLFARDGLAMLRRLRGMFAFALYDADARRLHLARDTYGIKPLYYADDGESFRFASQVKALLAGGAVDRRLDPAGVAGFCLLGTPPEPFTCHEAIRALPAGHTLTVDSRGVGAPRAFETVAQILAEARTAPAGDPLPVLRAALRDSVEAHLLADVEIGLFLSAGVDSSALLGLMRDCGQTRIRAITLGFDEFAGSPSDEVALAGAVAAHYGAEHVVRRVTRAEFEEELPRLLAAMDQPSIDGVNVWFAAKAAREAGLKAALSGVGGDELFAGYSSFLEIPFWSRATYVPHRLPGLGASMRRLCAALDPELARGNPKLLSLVEYGGSYEGAYLLRRGLFLPHELPGLLGAERAAAGLERLGLQPLLRSVMTPDPRDPVRRVCALESGLYLRNQLLRDADWAGMAHSVEIRAPLVDRALLQAVAPVMAHFSGGRGKAALAAAPSAPPPPHVLARPKNGFSIPMRAWLGDVAEDRLTSRAWARRLLARLDGAC
jgi:asparagine synthase (glutamine-hydrolysing)